MDKRDALWIIGGLTALYICAATSLMTHLLAFLILGRLPGTDTVMPQWIPYFIYPLLALALIGWLASHTLYIGEASIPVKNKKVTRTPRTYKKKVSTAKPVKRRSRAAV